MTADCVKLPYDVIGRISSLIVAEIPGINRVAHHTTSKRPRPWCGNEGACPLIGNGSPKPDIIDRITKALDVKSES